MTDDERSARESGGVGAYKPYGALFVTMVLAGVILGFWGLLFVLSLLRS